MEKTSKDLIMELRKKIRICRNYIEAIENIENNSKVDHRKDQTYDDVMTALGSVGHFLRDASIELENALYPEHETI